MSKKIKIIAGILTVLFCILLGCNGKKEQGESLLLPATQGDVMEDASHTKAFDGEETVESKADFHMYEGSEEVQESNSVVTIEYVIHICGAVQSPGVYILPQDSRVYQAVEAAGGFQEDAAQDYLNQADLLSDGMKIYVPTLEEAADMELQQDLQLQTMNATGQSQTQQQEQNDLVNINQANEELLCTLPGIGSSKAKSIIAHREFNGAFQTIEDIKNVEGIKEGLFQKIRNKITV